MSRDVRLAAHRVVSAALAARSDRELRRLVEGAPRVGAGIGGETVLVEVEGTAVFVKQVRVTDVERRPEYARSTANLFGLPSFCHYGVGRVGSPGFGAWRELAVHAMTTGWVLAGEHEGFPLTYHWRVLPDAGRPLPEELADVERAVAHWGGGPEIRHRIEEIRRATAGLTLFLEYLPHTLHDWLNAQLSAGDEAAERACAMVDDQLNDGIDFMNAHGLLHFDAHFANILTDGRRLYFADYGLALSSRFDLTPDEAGFHERHRAYDRAYARTHLANFLAAALYGHGHGHRYGNGHSHGPEERAAFLRACAGGTPPNDLPPGIAALLTRYAPTAVTTGDFHRRFRQESRATPLPPELVGGNGRGGPPPR